MKILCVAHGWPPEQLGGTENAARELARALARAGHEVLGVAGTLRASGGPEVEVEWGVDRAPDRASADAPQLRVARIRRPDLYFDHWHKSRSPAVVRAFRGILRAERPDVVHVHHWLRLSRDLVAAAAREGVPGVVTLHDHWTTCPIAFRVRADTRAACDAPVGVHPCVRCAGSLPPHTPWVPMETAAVWLFERQRDLVRELELARVVVAPTRAHARSVAGFLEPSGAGESWVVVPPAAAPVPASPAPPVSPASPRPASPEAPLTLAAWGQCARHKGTDLLIAALGRLRGPRRVELVLAGAWESPGFEAEQRALAAGLPVRFTGPYTGLEELRSLLTGPAGRPAQVMVSATRARESYGVVLDEARALGLAAVLPRTPAFEERAPDGSGALHFDAGDADALAAALDELAADPRRVELLRAEASALAGGLPDPDEIARRHVALYERAVSAGAPELAEEAWFEERMGTAALADWDRALEQHAGAGPRGAGSGERGA